jgi:maltooligosyltrehalose trehalohydrolase
MNSSLIEQRIIGLNFRKEAPPGILVWAPWAKKLILEVEGKRNYTLKKHSRGFWQGSCPDVKPEDRYMLNIDGKSYPDPASLSQPDGVHQASQAVDLFEIRNMHKSRWDGISLHDLIIYELHVGAFTPGGRLGDIHEKLEYLRDLGITAIKIMPLGAFPGERNWGYDGAFPFAVQASYGGAAEFARLVEACHENGLAVILDVIYNHFGPEGSYLNSFGPVFTNKYKTPWGDAINFDDEYCDGVRQFFIENALMWLRDFHVDGLRLDAVHAIKDLGARHFLQELKYNIDELNSMTMGNHFLIGECDLNDSKYLRELKNTVMGLMPNGAMNGIMHFMH